MDKALDDCNRSLTLKSDDPHAFDSRGFVYLKGGQFAQAIADYDAALRLDPNLANSLYGRALAKRHYGDLQGADRDRDAAMKINPDLPSKYVEEYGVTL